MFTGFNNPWDVVNWCSQLLHSSDRTPHNYWVNTGSNAEVKYFITQLGNGVTKLQIEKLIAGEMLQKKINLEITYDTIYDSIENLWSLLFMTGYLTQCKEPDNDLFWLKIPNLEVRSIFTDLLLEMFTKDVKKDGVTLQALCDALQKGNAEKAEQIFTSYMKKTVSVRDTFVKKELKENFYHGMLLGILGFKEGWTLESNREAGDGYSDLLVEIDEEDIGIIIEIKYAENSNLDVVCKKALQQIANKNYAVRLHDDGMKHILKYGIACHRKECRIMVESPESSQ